MPNTIRSIYLAAGAIVVTALAMSPPIAHAASSAIPENPMIDPSQPALTSTGLNRAQETTVLQGLGFGLVLLTGTQSPDECHLVQLSHQQLICPIMAELHYTMYPHHRPN